MTTIVDQGNGRFRIITDAEEIAASRTFAPTLTLAEASGPPMPGPVPNVSPVYEEKRQAAVTGSMTPAAAADLYRTPTSVYYTQEDPLGEGVAGQYRPGRRLVVPLAGSGQGRMYLWDPGDTDRAQTMRHEYLHKRYFEDLDPVDRVRWLLDHRDVTPEWVYPLLESNAIYNTGGFQPPNAYSVMPRESYAYAGADPEQLSSEQRILYYPGVYDEQALRQRAAERVQEQMARQERWQGEGEQLFSQPIPVEQFLTDRRREIETFDPNVRPFTELQTALYYGTPEYNPFPWLGPDSGLTPWGGAWWLGR